MAASGRAYSYFGNEQRVGVRNVLDATWNDRVYLMAGEGVTTEGILWFANAPGTVINIPWVPTRQIPLVVSILHIDAAAGLGAAPLGWAYRVEMV